MPKDIYIYIICVFTDNMPKKNSKFNNELKENFTFKLEVTKMEENILYVKLSRLQHWRQLWLGIDNASAEHTWKKIQICHNTPEVNIFCINYIQEQKNR